MNGRQTVKAVTLCLIFSGLFTNCKEREPSSYLRFYSANLAKSGQFPATVALPGCTGVKIHDRYILTAAHCLLDTDRKTISPSYIIANDVLPTVDVYHGVVLGMALSFHLKVKNIYVHSTFLRDLLAHKGDREFSGNSISSDVGVIELLEPLKKIGNATLITDALPETAVPVVLGGYGCQYDYWQRKFHDLEIQQQRLRQNRSLFPEQESSPTALASGENFGELRFAYNKLTNRMGSMYQVRIEKLADGNPKLCPGDSGGPVYYNDSHPDKLDEHHFKKVIAVNSHAGPFEDSFSSLDDANPNRVGSCLTALLNHKRKTGCWQDNAEISALFKP